MLRRVALALAREQGAVDFETLRGLAAGDLSDEELRQVAMMLADGEGLDQALDRVREMRHHAAVLASVPEAATEPIGFSGTDIETGQRETVALYGCVGRASQTHTHHVDRRHIVNMAPRRMARARGAHGSKTCSVRSRRGGGVSRSPGGDDSGGGSTDPGDGEPPGPRRALEVEVASSPRRGWSR